MGKRHTQNLVSLGHDVSIIDVDVNKREQLSLDYDVYSSISEAFNKEQFDIAIITSPTSVHIPQTQAIATEYDVKGIFCEKPLSFNSDGTQTLVNICHEKDIVFMTGCNLLFSSGVRLVKMLLDNKTIGNPYYAEYFYGSWLPDWRPGTDYRTSYSASITGGILLDDIHSINLFLYFFGKPTSFKGNLHRTGLLEIKKEDISNTSIDFENGLTTHLHSDYLSKKYMRNVQIFGDKGIIQLDFYEGYVNLFTESLPEWRTFNTKEDTNEMYLREMQYFIEAVNNKIDIPFNGVEEMKIVTEIKNQNELI